jgi:hypothetical protein
MKTTMIRYNVVQVLSGKFAGQLRAVPVRAERPAGWGQYRLRLRNARYLCCCVSEDKAHGFLAGWKSANEA